MAVRLSISIAQGSPNIANNTSPVSVSVVASWDSGSWNKEYPPPSGTLTIDGTAYPFANTFNDDRTSTGCKTLVTKTVDVAHNDDGSKTLACYASFATGTGSGTVSASASMPLTMIPRKSNLSVSNGTLGAPQTLSVHRQAADFTHTITYICGSISGTICEKSSDTSISWTPPLDLAQQNTTGASVPVMLTITTYNGNTNVGSDTKTVSYSIPDSVKPSVSLYVSDVSGCYTKYGAYVQGKSALAVTVQESGNQGSAIRSRSVAFDGQGYTDAYFTTPAIKGCGDLDMTAMVRDSRQRTNSTTQTLPVLAYSAPKITDFSVYRSNASGVADKSGTYLTVKFSAEATPLNNKNSFSVTVQKKTVAESDYGEYPLDISSYSVSGYVFAFPADTASTYEVALIVADDFGSVPPRTGLGSSIAKTWSSYAGGKGFAFGKVAGRENTLDMGWAIEMNGNRVTGLPDPEGDSDAVPRKFLTLENIGAAPIAAYRHTPPFMAKHAAVTNLLAITIGDFEHEAMWDGWIAVEDASTLQNSPVTSGAFHAFRRVSYNPGGTTLVKLEETYPVEGRVWLRVYDQINNRWLPTNGWRCIENEFAPSGYGLGEANGRYCTNPDHALENGFYYLAGAYCTTPDGIPGEIGYGTMLVERREGQIFQTMRHTDWVITRRSVDGGATWETPEWVNPPCHDGVIYRTIQRFRGLIVYEVSIPVGYVSAGSNSFAHGVPLTYPISLDVINNGREILTGYSGITSLTADRTNIHMQCTNDFGDIVFRMKFV